jgi:LmbE family N-acetylglucosaminyl deacetylase
MKKKVLVIVAHPDDETIWMGGTLLKNKNNWDTTIISLCRKNDTDRAPKFEKVCRILNAKSYMFDLDDSETGVFKEIFPADIISRILQVSYGKRYDYIFTHGEYGEYGHVRHIEAHNAVIEMLNKKLLEVEKCFLFSYLKEEDGTCNINPNADKLIKLEQYDFKMKRQVIQDVYGFKEDSFESKCCLDQETFSIKL